MAEFDGKVALVTGGGRGIGQAVGALLLSRGAKVASFDLDASGSPDGAVPVEGDATDSSSVADAVARVEREVGPIDAVVCSAGTAATRCARWTSPTRVAAGVRGQLRRRIRLQPRRLPG